MKAVMIRAIDQLGRIVLPQEMRNAEGLKVGTKMGIFIKNNGDIILRRAFAGCLICGAEKDLKTVNEKVLCSKCIAEIQRPGSAWNE